MAAPVAIRVGIVIALAACSNPPAPTRSPFAAPSAGPTSTTLPEPSSTQAGSPLTSPSGAGDPATGLRIAPPYQLEKPSGSELAQLSGNIQGLASDLAQSAGADFTPSNFPMGARFVRDTDKDVGVIVVLDMPAEVAEMRGLLEPVAAAVAAEVNAVLSYVTIQGVKVGVIRGPIASTVAIVDGQFVMAQSGQPAVAPRDLMAAVIAANAGGLAGSAPPTE